jgi:hypothetical protein
MPEAAMPTAAARGSALTTFAILFGLLAVSNFLKPFQLSETAGFVFFGLRLDGLANTVAGPLFGAYLASMAMGIWRLRRWALPMVWAYLGYVVLNLILFRVWGPPMPGEGIGRVVFSLVYMAIAIGVPLSTALILRRRQAELG